MSYPPIIPRVQEPEIQGPRQVPVLGPRYAMGDTWPEEIARLEAEENLRLENRANEVDLEPALQGPRQVPVLGPRNAIGETWPDEIARLEAEENLRWDNRANEFVAGEGARFQQAQRIAALVDKYAQIIG